MIPGKVVIRQSPMSVKSIVHLFKRIVGAWLAVLVHFDAFRIDPRAYLTATKWRIKRKRVRARSQFAPLLSRSPRAYRLWILREQYGPSSADPSRLIVALVDIGAGRSASALDQTLQSLSAEGLTAIVVGSANVPDVHAALDRIDWARKPWLMPMAPGDLIAPGAADAYRAALQNAGNQEELRLLYADDDQLRGRRRTSPHFKPDWNAELFDHHDYLTGSCIVRAGRSDLQSVADAADWAVRLIARVAGQGGVLHVHRMLHHRRHRPAPRLPLESFAIISGLPSVSIIVPTRNRVDLLRTCLEGLAATDYPDMEVIVVDNDSNDPATLAYLAMLDPARYRVLRHAGPFNYPAINNRAVEQARGELLCLLNNDIEVMSPDWLSIMATQAMRSDVGAVGARLLYPDGRIQHAGVVLGVGGGAGHGHKLLKPQETGYFWRHMLPQFASAVTGACLVVQKARFCAVGGLDERNFAVAFNDVDLCLKLNEKGWQSFYEPRACLIHHESVSRGFDHDPVAAKRFASELAMLKTIWGTDRSIDRYHHPHLSRFSEQFSVNL